MSPLFQVLHMHISCADKLSLTTSGCPLQIRCKNFLNIVFVFPRERDCHDILTSLQTLYQPGRSSISLMGLLSAWWVLCQPGRSSISQMGPLPRQGSNLTYLTTCASFVSGYTNCACGCTQRTIDTTANNRSANYSGYIQVPARASGQ